MIWAESVGGPLAVVETSALGEWTGCEGDYERACAIAYTADPNSPSHEALRFLLQWFAAQPAKTITGTSHLFISDHL